MAGSIDAVVVEGRVVALVVGAVDVEKDVVDPEGATDCGPDALNGPAAEATGFQLLPPASPC